MRRDAHGLVERTVGVSWVALLGMACAALSLGPALALGLFGWADAEPQWAMALWSAAALFGAAGVALVWLDRVPPVTEIRLDRGGAHVERRSLLGRSVVHLPPRELQVDVHTLLDGRSCLRVRGGGRSWNLGLGEDPEDLAAIAADVGRLWSVDAGSPDEVPAPLARMLRDPGRREG